MAKSVKLSEETSKLLNLAKAKYINEKPELKKHTDDSTINLTLQKYLKGD